MEKSPIADSFVSHPFINKNTIEKREYQDEIAKTALSGNTLCVLPTGLGKTNIAALVVAGRLQKDMNKKILFLAPTKPLVEQHRKTFERYLRVEKLQVITGSNKPQERWRLYQNADIVFSTPQTIRNDLKRGILNLKDFSLLIVDEAHRCVGNYAYVYVAKKYIQQASDPLILALTASPGGYRYKIDDVKQKLFISNVEIRIRDDEDVLPYIPKLQTEWVELELPKEFLEIKKLLEKCKNEKIQKLLDWRILHTNKITKSQILELQKRLSARKTGSSYAALSILAEVLKIDHALILLETQCLHSLKKYISRLAEQKTKAVIRLMSNEDFKKAISLCDVLINNNVEHPKLGILKNMINKKPGSVIVFTQYRDTIEEIIETLNATDAKPVAFIGQAKKSGKGLSQKEQVQIINEFKMGFYNTLVATSIAEEGLDIAEVDAVIFYEPIPSEIRRIQRMGRTARTRSGRVIFLVTKGTRDEASYWIAYHKERKMKKILHEMRQKSIVDYK